MHFKFILCQINDINDILRYVSSPMYIYFSSEKVNKFDIYQFCTNSPSCTFEMEHCEYLWSPD